MHEITINYRLENDAREKDENDEWFTQIKCNTSEIKNHYISSNQILYEVYHVANIEFLDELIAKILEKDESGNNIINSVTYFGKENKDRAYYEAQGLKCLNPAHECDGYKHMTIICFARKYFHHPNCRDLVQTDISYNKYFKQNDLKIDKLLIESIENAIQLLNQHHKYCKLL